MFVCCEKLFVPINRFTHQLIGRSHFRSSQAAQAKREINMSLMFFFQSLSLDISSSWSVPNRFMMPLRISQHLFLSYRLVSSGMLLNSNPIKTLMSLVKRPYTRFPIRDSFHILLANVGITKQVIDYVL